MGVCVFTLQQSCQWNFLLQMRITTSLCQSEFGQQKEVGMWICSELLMLLNIIERACNHQKHMLCALSMVASKGVSEQGAKIKTSDKYPPSALWQNRRKAPSHIICEISW